MNKKDKPSILIVDDDKNTRDGLNRALKLSYDVHLAENAEKALDILSTTGIDILLSDVRMPGMDGLALLQRALARNPGLVCILLTAYGSVEVAVEAMKRGAFDFLTKPVNLDHLELLLQRGLRSMAMESENMNLREQLEDKFGMENIVGSAPVMQQLFDAIRQVAPTQASVLIKGESGTGKELVAHAVHNLSSRSKGPFVAVHCAALSQNLLESELFGHEKGAFTGAISRRKGRFENADGGTLFLDEISEIDLSVQVKLLRVLESRNFERVGGGESIDVDIRLVAATNKNLKDLVEAGKFREDLFFRLDVVDIELPPLRDRLEDIPLLCDAFVKEFNKKNSKHVDGFTPDVLKLLTAYTWPGNVRELRNAIEKMIVFARGNRLTVRDIPAHIDIRNSSVSAANAGGGPFAGIAQVGESLAENEKKMIYAALTKNAGNRTKAALELGISRRTLQRKLKAYGLEADD